MLDFSHNVLLASDIEKFADKKSALDDELKSGQLDTAYALYNYAQKRRLERLNYALSLLDKPMTFDNDDVIEVDRSKSSWPTTDAELDKLWYQKVKYDALNLTLAGKKWPEIKDILTKRYQSAIKRLTQAKRKTFSKPL